MSNDGLSEDYGDLGEKRNRRIRIIAWTVIVALILGGGGATVLTLLLRLIRAASQIRAWVAGIP